MQLTGAEIIVECLKEQGVDTIFGYPGGAALNIYDALYKHQNEIKHYLTSHEQGAAHAADGYARSTGKVGVCLATSGPGATNLVTGIATAYMDSIPMVAITANVALPFLGKDSFQEIDIAGVTMPITKHNFIVKDVNKLADTMRKAFYIAKEGRQGPVLVDITKDVTANKAEYTKQDPQPIQPHTDKITTEDIEKAIELIKESKQPLVYAGGGVKASDGCKEIIKFVEKIDAPVCLTAMGLGVIPSSNDHCTGMIGMHGTETSNILANKCDLLIAVGARFSDRVATNFAKFAPNAKVLHIDIDAAEINKNVSAYHSIVGDCS
ncbi:MAG: acetolactate synthase large subunit, partial [Firmicutes bacterium]|nr:acetolactate synthase large subunit [Bacillota bacterium]